jgi:nuclear-control-of-ATPase protein 2
LLICEADVLRQRAIQILPATIYQEFLEDMNDLLDTRTGVATQLKVLERISWAYAKWLR